MIKTIEKTGESQIIEKKSKFLGKAFLVNNIEEAEEMIEKIKKEHYDARHNCYAYRILAGKNIIEKQSDDGEPSRYSRKSNAYYFAKKRANQRANRSN